MARAHIPLAAVPMELPAFLHWFRQTTESRWATYETCDFSMLEYGDASVLDWQRGTRWLDGLSAAQITAIEQRRHVRFPPDYRLFLHILNAVDRPKIGRLYRVDADGQDYLANVAVPSFYNWLADDAEIDRYLNHWIREGLEFDIEYNQLWRASWGPMPQELAARKQQMADVLAQAPPLIPIYGHRYLLTEPCEAGNPIYSIVQADIIIYGDTLRDYLLFEFIDLLPLDREEVERFWHQQRLARAAYYQTIPFWHELATL